MVEATIFVPVADNDGMVFSNARHRIFEGFILERFGGLSQSSERVEGTWVDGERVYKDSLILYIVGLRSLTDGGKLGEVIHFAKRHYRQEAIYLRYLGVAEII